MNLNAVFRASSRVAATLVLGVVLSPAVPAATTVNARFDFLFDQTRVADDNQFFLNRVVVEFGVSRPVLEPALPRLRYVEADLPVALFLSRASGRPLDVIVSLRAGGLPWCQVFERVHTPPDILFVGIDRDPGPPYGKAWGHWKKRGRGVRLADADISGLVGVQVGHRIVGATPYELARARGQGRTVVAYVAEKGGRGHKGHGNGNGRGNGNAQGQGPGKGHGNGHGKGKD